jgi:hypothetical protein
VFDRDGDSVGAGAGIAEDFNHIQLQQQQHLRTRNERELDYGAVVKSRPRNVYRPPRPRPNTHSDSLLSQLTSNIHDSDGSSGNGTSTGDLLLQLGGVGLLGGSSGGANRGSGSIASLRREGDVGNNASGIDYPYRVFGAGGSRSGINNGITMNRSSGCTATTSASISPATAGRLIKGSVTRTMASRLVNNYETNSMGDLANNVNNSDNVRDATIGNRGRDDDGGARIITAVRDGDHSSSNASLSHTSNSRAVLSTSASAPASSRRRPRLPPTTEP